MIDSKPPFQETLRAIGARARALRLRREFSQAELATRAGVGIATIHRFEKTGTASLETALRIATALFAERAFDRLFEMPPFTSIDEALAPPEATTRRRAPRRR